MVAGSQQIAVARGSCRLGSSVVRSPRATLNASLIRRRDQDQPVSGNPVLSCIWSAVICQCLFLHGPGPLHVRVIAKLLGASSKPSATTCKSASLPQSSHLTFFLLGFKSRPRARRDYSPSRPLRYSSRRSWATRVSRRLALAISRWASRHTCWAPGMMSSFSTRCALARTSSAVPRASG